jgi:hypothetical protein
VGIAILSEPVKYDKILHMPGNSEPKIPTPDNGDAIVWHDEYSEQLYEAGLAPLMELARMPEGFEVELVLAGEIDTTPSRPLARHYRKPPRRRSIGPDDNKTGHNGPVSWEEQ